MARTGRKSSTRWTPPPELVAPARQLWESLSQGKDRGFRPERALYADLEGKRGITFYVPAGKVAYPNDAPMSGGYGHLRRPQPKADMSLESLKRLLSKLGNGVRDAKFLVVFSGSTKKRRRPKEVVTMKEIFGPAIWKPFTAINLHLAVRSSPLLKRLIKERHPMWRVKRDGSLNSSPSLCLEALERTFGLERPRALRSASYEDDAGMRGEMKPLAVFDEIIAGRRPAKERDLLAYCRWDVWSMYQIALRARRCAEIVKR